MFGKFHGICQTCQHFLKWPPKYQRHGEEDGPVRDASLFVAHHRGGRDEQAGPLHLGPQELRDPFMRPLAA